MPVRTKVETDGRAGSISSAISSPSSAGRWPGRSASPARARRGPRRGSPPRWRAMTWRAVMICPSNPFLSVDPLLALSMACARQLDAPVRPARRGLAAGRRPGDQGAAGQAAGANWARHAYNRRHRAPLCGPDRPADHRRERRARTPRGCAPWAFRSRVPAHHADRRGPRCACARATLVSRRHRRRTIEMTDEAS